MRMFAISYMKEQIVRRSPMAYTLDEFCSESRALLKVQPLMDALAQMSERLGRLLSNPAFVAETFYVLAHVQEGKKTGKPHSHGASWAIYGNAREHTEMTEWRRVNPESEDHAVLERVSRYRLDPGQTKAYGPGVIHSTAHPEKAWVIRVTGTDLDVLPRYHFRKQDRILEKT
jgi:hypothetical protein